MEANIKSHSEYLVCPPAALSTSVHLILMNWARFASSCCKMLLHSSTKPQVLKHGGTPVSARMLSCSSCPTVERGVVTNDLQTVHFIALATSAIIIYGSLNKHEKHCLNPFQWIFEKCIWILNLSLKYSVLNKGCFLFAEIYVYKIESKVHQYAFSLGFEPITLTLLLHALLVEKTLHSMRSVFARFTSHYTVVFNRL